VNAVVEVVVVVVVVIIVENRTPVDREETRIGVRKKEKGEEKYENNIRERIKKVEKRKESRLTLALYISTFIPSPWSVFDSSVTFIYFVRNEYRSQNINMW
jgi:hypothetical protein